MLALRAAAVPPSSGGGPFTSLRAPIASSGAPRSGAPFCFVLPVSREPLLLTSLLPLSRVSSALSHLGSDGCF